MATECTPWASSQSRSACSCEVTVPNTAGRLPPTETCMCSLPTSTNAASGSSIGSACNMMSLHIGIPQCARRPWPGHVTGRTNLSSGKQSSPECATDRDQGYSLQRAIRRLADAPEVRSATLPGTATRDLTIDDPRFMVRVRFWQKLEAFHEPVTVQGPCAVLAKTGGFP